MHDEFTDEDNINSVTNNIEGDYDFLDRELDFLELN